MMLEFLFSGHAALGTGVWELWYVLDRRIIKVVDILPMLYGVYCLRTVTRGRSTDEDGSGESCADMTYVDDRWTVVRGRRFFPSRACPTRIWSYIFVYGRT